MRERERGQRFRDLVGTPAYKNWVRTQVVGRLLKLDSNVIALMPEFNQAGYTAKIKNKFFYKFCVCVCFFFPRHFFFISFLFLCIYFKNFNFDNYVG